MKILIYGAGAVGLGLASFLIKPGEDVSLLGRTPTCQALKSQGLLRTGIFGEIHIPPEAIHIYDSLREIPPSPFDHILICAKSFDSETAAKELAGRSSLWDKNTCFVLCQNGWGNAEIFSKHLPQRLIYNARIITGHERPSPHHVNITVHADDIHLGSLFSSSTEKMEPLARALSSGGIPAIVVPDISKDLWAKMLYNCALNSLGAICDVPYGQLGEDDFSRGLMEGIFKEIFLVMTAAGHSTHWANAVDYAKIFYSKLLPATANHLSSTLQDIRAGRRTEIDALNGIIADLGKRYGIPTPVNQTAHALVKFLERNGSKKD